MARPAGVPAEIEAIPVLVHADIWDSGDCGRNDSCIELHRKRSKCRPVHPTLPCGSARYPAEHGDEKAVGERNIFGGRRFRTGERYPPVLMPQAGHDFVDRIVGACFRDGSQVRVNGGGAGGRMSEITLDDAQVDTGFQQMRGK